MSEEVSSQSPGLLYAEDKDPDVYVADADPMSKRETRELVRAYYGIQDPARRNSLNWPGLIYAMMCVLMTFGSLGGVHCPNGSARNLRS